MTVKKWLSRNTHSLSGKTVAVTGSTGGIGRELCRYLAALDADLLLMDRDPERSQAFRQELIKQFPNVSVTCIACELEDSHSVRAACDKAQEIGVDVLILNAGAYAIPRRKCDLGYDNVFTINFVSPYYIVKRLLPTLRKRGGKVVAVGSIAHRYSETDAKDVDFSTRNGSALAYGNSKRYLMFSLYELFRDENGVTLSVTHPGITFTNITAHYPKVIFAIIKHPMKVIFMKPRKASLCILRGVFDTCGHSEWIGPSIFDIWGLPKKRKLRSVSAEESRRIGESAEKIYNLRGPSLELAD